jgi:hypothetical protein
MSKSAPNFKVALTGLPDDGFSLRVQQRQNGVLCPAGELIGRCIDGRLTITWEPGDKNIDIAECFVLTESKR